MIDVAAAAYGSTVDVFGHSFGGNVAFGATAHTPNIRRLVLYEGWPAPNIAHRSVPANALARLDALVARDRREELLETFYRDIVLMTPTRSARCGRHRPGQRGSRRPTLSRES